MAIQRVPVLTLTQFDGTNVEELPIQNYLDACGPGTGHTEVVDGVLIISWPGFPGSGTATIQTGDWVDSAGTVWPDAKVQAESIALDALLNPT